MRVSVVIAVTLASSTLLGDDTARVYVYARRETAARSWLSISVGDVVVAEVKQGLFFAISLAPGRHTLSVVGGLPLPIDVGSGEKSFVRLDWNYGMDRGPIANLSRVRQSEAATEMRYLSYIPTKRVHSTFVPKTDPSEPLEPQLHTRDK
jgi:hypothetical protein